MKTTRIRKRDERLLFLKQLVKNPKSMGALAPSSPALAEFMCRHIDLTNDLRIVEIGAGTGRFTQALLKNGLRHENLCVVELDPAMYRFLKENFPSVTILQGDASQLPNLLPSEWVGQVDVIISGIPMVNLSFKDQYNIVKACFKSLTLDGHLLQFTYGPLSPLPSRKLGLKQKRLGHVLLNFPPATVWQYRLGSAQEAFKKTSRITRIKRRSLHQLKLLKKRSLKVLKNHEEN